MQLMRAEWAWVCCWRRGGGKEREAQKKASGSVDSGNVSGVREPPSALSTLLQSSR